MAANSLHFPGVVGNFAWVPGVPNLDGTGTLEFIAKVNLDIWPPDANQILISKWTGSAGYLFFLEAISNDLKLMWRDSGPARIAQATVTPNVTVGDWLWFMAIATEDGVDRDVFFYTSTDTTDDPDDVTWTQLGAEVVVPFGAADLVTNTAVVFVGAQSATVATMAGSIAAARINFNGVTELDIDFTDLTEAEVDAGSFTEDSRNAATVTIAGTAWAYVRPCDILVAARDLDSGYKRGDPIVAVADGHTWGAAETLPNFWIVKVPDIDLAVARAAIEELFEVAQPGDEEFDNEDPEDRKIKRHRRRVRGFVDELPAPKRNDLLTTGITTLSRGQARSLFRKLTWNRTTGQVEDTGIEEFG